VNNNVSLNSWGIYFDSSTNNTIINNNLFKNVDGITFENDANHNKILFNNILNTTSFGIYIRSNSRNNLVIGNNISNNSRGVRFTQSNNNTIFGNTISSNTNDGLVIYYYSSFNEVIGNNISSNNKGLIITYGSYNTKVFHNNFIGNTEHVYTDMNSTWDNDYPSGGNYWSNYTGVDFRSGISQNDTGSDGIGDAKHVINQNNTDRYPLMAPYSTFDVGTWNGTPYNADVVSNSTVSDFHFDPQEGPFLKFNVTGQEGTAGFCRVAIPKNLLWAQDGQWIVLVGDAPITNYTTASDQNYTYLYFTYGHSTKTVQITGTNVIPELSSTTIATLLMILAMLATAFATRKFRKEASKLRVEPL
jgi:parallel beta-helix repeat protein